MRLGLSCVLKHDSPAEWAERTRALGLRTAKFPVSFTAPDHVIEAYARVCREADITIAEVGAWKNLFAPDPAARAENYAYVLHQLELAEYVGAACTVNISGACGEVWDGGYPGNYTRETFDRIVETVRKLLNEAKVKKTAYTLEPMPWMLPWDGESYLELIRAVDDPRFAVHMDGVNLMNSPDRYFHCAEFLEHTFGLLHGLIRSTHVKDVQLQRTLTLHLKEVPIGEGGFDVAAYMRLTEAEGPESPVLLEHLADEEVYLKALAALKQILDREGIRY